MNVIIANKYKDALSQLNIDVIKRLDGEFDVETIADTFANFYFNRMIIDITAIKDCFNINNIQRLSTSLDATKIILFLSDDPRINNSFLSKVISLGIYNFTHELSGIDYLMENPNSYRDVAQYHDLAANDEANLKKSGGLFGGGTKPQNSNPILPNPYTNSNMNAGVNPYANNGNSGDNFYSMPNNQNFNSYNSDMSYGSSGPIIIGFKDLTDDAGATTLVYMLKKQLKSYKTLAVEINNNDFSYFRDSELMSTSAEQLINLKNKFNQFDIVLIDINNSSLDMDGTCNDVIYLLEPSTIKLNTLMRRDKQALERIKNKKIVLNKSLLTVSDVKEFEYEAKVKMFYNIPPLDERKDHQMILDSFLDKLGVINSINSGGSSGGLFDIFKK